MIGYAMCGSFCTVERSLEQMKRLKESGNDILPIMSENLANTDTRFGSADDICEKVRSICGREIVSSIVDAEPLGPSVRLEALIVAPCTGNTLAKIACGITDTAVTMAVKAHSRCLRPTVIALASNDALSAGLVNIGKLMQKKNVYFVPMRQDSPHTKPSSLVCDFSLIPDTLAGAIAGRQLQPVFAPPV